MKKTRFIGLFLAIVLIFTSLVPATAFAAQSEETAEGEVIEENATAAAPYAFRTECVDEKNNIVKVWLDLNPTFAESITAFSFSFRVVNRNGEVISGRDAEFTFAASLDKAVIKESRFDSKTQTLDLYVASTENLVKTASTTTEVEPGVLVATLTNTLELGTVKVEKLPEKENEAFKIVLNGRVGNLMTVGLDGEVKDFAETVAGDVIIPVDGTVYDPVEEYIVNKNVVGNGDVDLYAEVDGKEVLIPGNTVDENTKVLVKVVAHKDYKVASIKVISSDGKETDITSSKTFVVDGDKTIKVEFVKTKPATSDKECSCICHVSGFRGFLYKIARIFWKLFGIKRICGCDAYHY